MPLVISRTSGCTAFRAFKKFSGGGGAGESDYSVCTCPLLKFLQFRSVRLRQFKLEGRDAELDNSFFERVLHCTE